MAVLDAAGEIFAYINLGQWLSVPSQTDANVLSYRPPLRLPFPNDFTTNQENQEPLKSFALLQEEIGHSRSILALEPNWDGEGSPGYKPETLKRATDFLLDNAQRLWNNLRIGLDTPTISPGPEASIDIHWKNERHELLINIPEDDSETGTYYGDNTAKQVVKGNLDKSNNLWLMLWLMK